MLKIKKGIKKKIKGKKEKEDDLFDPENLAKYKKELEESRREKSGEGNCSSAAAVQEVRESASASAVGKSAEEDDEWKRFKQLTAGIDVTLKKTSGDLDRIKTTSYFQKKVSSAVVEEKKVQWEDVEKEAADFHQEPNQNLPQQAEEDSWGPPLPVQEVQEELKFNEVEQEIEVLDDGLFDTSYLDAIESGEIQLAYIPDSPVQELDGDDPFDTSGVAEVVKKIHEEEVKEKRKINLGGAVDFFTKKSDVVYQVEVPAGTPYTDKTAEIKKTKRGRPVHVDLLGFDGEETEAVEGAIKPPRPPRDQNSKPTPQDPEKDGGFDLNDLIREFETSDHPKPVTRQNIVSNLDLLTKPEHVEEEVRKEDEDDVWFQTGNEEVLEAEAKSRRESVVDDVDPFDTSVVEKLGFGKAELKILEDELLPATSAEELPKVSQISQKSLDKTPENPPPLKQVSLDDDFDFDPRKDEPPAPSFHPLDIIHPDSDFETTSLTPQLRNLDEPEEIDPFDTSSVSHISLPGKSELRFLEDELVSSNPVNPGQDYSAILNVQPLTIQDPEPVLAPAIINPLDAPHVVSDILELRHPPLKSQPTLPTSASVPKQLKSFDDPFDTSDVLDSFAPGKNELKELESELLNSTVDFVPPRVCPLRNFKILHHNTSITTVVTERQESLHPFDSVDGDSAEVEHHRPLSPQVASGDNCFEDPFDTSAVTAILPGKIEAKLLEEELAAASFGPVLTHAFARNTFSLPPNTPPVPPPQFPIQNFEDEEIDPFDTSIANSPQHVPPQYVNPTPDSSMASNPFLTGGGGGPFSYDPQPPPSQGENPFLSSMTSGGSGMAYGMGNPFADFVAAPQPPAAAMGYMSATEAGINSWNDMHTSYGSASELELQQPVSTATQDLLFTVTGALEATSDSLLDRLRYAQPSPVPQPPSPTPSPRTPSPDLLMGDEDWQPLPPFLQPSIPKAPENTSTIDLMGLYNKPADPTPKVMEVVSQPYAAEFLPSAQPAPFFENVKSQPAQKQAALDDIMDITLDTAPAVISPVSPKAEVVEIQPEPVVVEYPKPIEIEKPIVAAPSPIPERAPPARPAQPPPKAMPSRPPPPVPPAPRKEPPVPAQPALPAEVEQSFNLPKAEPYFAAPAAVEPPPSFTTSMYEHQPAFSSPVAAPVPVHTSPAPPPPVFVAPVPPSVASGFFGGDNFGSAVEAPRGRGAPPPPPSPRVPSSPQPPPQRADFDVFEDRFNSVPPEGDAFCSTQAGAFGGFDEKMTTTSSSSAWGDGGSSQGFDDSGSGFGNEDKFDEFLSLREPPPVPQSTPAKSRLNSGNDDFDNADTKMTVTIRQKDKLDFNLELVPTLAPPPKSPAISTGSVYSEENGSNFVPFLSSVKVTTGEGGVPIPRSDSQDSPQTPLFEEDQSVPLEDFPRIKYSGEGWEMQMRHPNKKKITGQRFWKKVYVRISPVNDIPTVQIYNSSKDKDPIQEIPLQPCYSVSDIAAQQFDQFGKIFTMKLQYIFYKERPGVRPGQITKAGRITDKLSQFAAYAIQGDYQGVKEFGSDLKKLGLPLEHAPQVSQLVKLGTQNFEEMKHFSMVIEEALFRLPVHRDRALTYKSEEVQVTLVDEYYVEQDIHGVVTRQIARVRLHFLSFLSGAAEVELGINDIRRQGKEVVGRHDIIPIATEEWIRIEDIEFSSCVQLNVFDDTKMVKFKPPDACYVELLRFRVRPPRHRELPLQVKTVFTTTGHRIEIRCDILVPGFTSRKLGQIPCEDVMIRIPIPECWIYMFRVEKHFRYGSVKSAHRRSGKVKGIERFLGAVEAVENSLMEVTSGQAKYEHQHKSIVWRVARLPKEGQGAYTTHSFFCHITLQPHEEIPSNLTKHCYVEFTMPHTTISHTVCRSVSVPMCDEPPEKCVKYLSRHEYIVEIEHTQGVAPATYSLAATVVKEAPVPEEVKEIPMEGKAQSDSDFSEDD